MKKYLLLVVSVVMSGLMMAGNVTPEQAEQLAQQFLNCRRLAPVPQPAARLNMIQHRKASHRANAPTAYYVFNVGQENGFVVVSGDDRTIPILGYAETGSFDTDEMPDHMKAWLQTYADQIAWLDAHPETPVATQSLRRARKVIKPLLRSQWGQDDPYNLLCPMDGNKSCAAGCVATAMAQLMYYYKHPAQTTKTIPGYTTDTKTIVIDDIGVTAIPWDDMQDTYSGKETDIQREAVAKLIQLCGVSVGMNYTSDGSNAVSAIVPDKLKTYFDYDAATTFVFRTDYRAADWEELIYEELAQNRPVYYSGSSVSAGHAFIVDGYDGDGLFHVNWGWNGTSNSYFVLSILDPYNNAGTGASPTTDGYSLGHSAIIGAQPNTGVVPQIPLMMTTQYINAPVTTVKAANGQFSFSLKSSFYNFTGAAHTFDWGIGIYDKQGSPIQIISIGTDTFNPNYGYKEKTCNVTIPSSWSGTFKLMMVTREHGKTEWLKNSDSQFNYLEATINGNTLTLKNPSMSPVAEMTVSGSLEVGGNVLALTKITNKGTFFNQQFYLRVGGTDVGGRYLDLDSEESGTVDIPFSPTESGTKTIQLGYKSYAYNETTQKYDETFNVIASKTITIAAAKSYTLAFSNGSVTNASGKAINDNKASLRFTVKNTGSYTYDNDLMVYSLTKRTDGSSYFDLNFTKPVPVTIEQGQSVQVNCDVPLNTDGTYWFIVVYKTQGTFIELTDSKRRYDALYNYTVTVPEDAPAGIETVSPPSVPVAQRIYTIGGIQLTPQQFEQAPKGLYIVNGRLVIK